MTEVGRTDRASSVARALVVALLLGAAGASTGAPLAAQDPDIEEGAEDEVQLDFQDLDFAFVVSALARTAGINLLYHDLPPKPVTLRTADPVPRAYLPMLIRTLAAANGVEVTEADGFMQLRGVGDLEEPDPRQLYIYRLEHASAVMLGQTLQALFGGPMPQGGGPQTTRPLSQQLQQLQEQGIQAQAAPTGSQQGIVITTRGGEGGVEGDVLIVPEEVTNSLMVRATPGDWSILEEAISALDLRPLQVVIEVVIAEVSYTEDLDVGVSFRSPAEGEGTEGVVELPPRQAPETPGDAFSVRLFGRGDVDVEASLSALAASGDVRILSRPVVLAQNNRQARILVGSQRPFVQISRTLPTDPTGSRDQVVQYREVGTVLTILPTINEDGYVNLAVVQEVSSATTETQFGAPVISTREAETQLLARNGQTVVLGGLVDQQTDRVHQGIPVLKDIPVLGHLFGSTRETTGNSELFLFLTPYVVATDADADALRREIEEERDLLEPYLPVTPLTPPVILPDSSGAGGALLLPDSTGGPGSAAPPDSTGAGGA